MRLLEIIITLLLALYLLWGRSRPRRTNLLPVAAFLLMLAHFATEGYRWQMMPLYVFATLLALQGALTLRAGGPASHVPPSMRTRIGQAATWLLLAIATALPILLPVPSIPAPGGPYAVGTRMYELTDSSRRELYSSRDEPRRFQIQVWYPADVSPADRHAPWMARADIYAPAIASYIHMPPFFLDHLALVKMPAFAGPRLAATREGYPVILFSHGWNGFSAQNTGQAIELASHGYVVVGVQHPYGAIISVFEDGEVARNNPAALPGGAPDQEYESAARKLAAQWAGDMAYALDFLQLQNDDAASDLYGSMDLVHVGAYGHSTGGGAAIQFCGTDPRCGALLGMDPFMRPVSAELLENGVTQPAYFMFSQVWADDENSRNNQLFGQFITRVPQAMGVITIDGTNHYDFTDLPMLSPLAPVLGLKGPINGPRVTAILNDYLLSFFDGTLKGIPMDPVLGQSTKYNEVKFIR